MFKLPMSRQFCIVAGLWATLLGFSGCANMTADDFNTIVSGVTDVAKTANEIEAARRAGRVAAQSSSTSTPYSPAAPVQPAPQPSMYAALGCARATQRSGGMCVENSCGRAVSLHLMAGNGATGSLSVGPGQCMPVAPGTAAAFACAGGHRFDWGRRACVNA
jgi:hypothetical protein